MQLFCWCEHQIHPYFRVGPLQVELLSMHPKTEVVMVHNVLGERLLGFLRNDTGRHFEFNLPTPQSTTDFNETSPQGDLRRLILQLASRISGLKTTKEIAIMVNAHPPGGYHHLHKDSVRDLGFRIYSSVPRPAGHNTT